jgi:hypothetical protein
MLFVLGAGADLLLAANELGRDEEPIVLTGADLPALVGELPSRIVAFRWEGAWAPVPVQIDERAVLDFGEVYGLEPSGQTVLTYTDDGTFAGADPDPSFDGDDELALLARDAGRRAPTGTDPAGTLPGSRVDVKLTRSDTATSAFVSLFRSDGSLDPTAGVAPVAYEFVLLSGDYETTYDTLEGPNPENTTLETEAYTAHFSDRWIRDGMGVRAGSATGVDLLDRIRFQFRPGDCSRTEDTFSDGEGAFLVNRTGPVRALRGYVGANSGPTTFRIHRFYPRREDVSTVVRVHDIPGVMDYLDLDPSVSGMTYLSDLLPGGAPIDGAVDTVPTGRVAWEAVTGPHGTVAQVHVLDTDIPDPEIVWFHRDEAVPDEPPCTGDASYHGAHGVRVVGPIPNTDPEVPGERFRFEVGRHLLYGSPDAGAALGERLADMIAAPLAVTVLEAPSCPDADGDGWSDAACEPDPGSQGGDCDDANASVNPEATEACDGIDNDCDASTADGASEPWLGESCDGTDSDQCLEGTLSCDGGVQACSDATADDVETCNGLDDDCDGAVDEGLATFTYWADGDGDGYGDPSSPLETCDSTTPAGYADNDGDCDDGSPAVNPGAAETACDDGLDNDCDGLADAEDPNCEPSSCPDADGDGWREASCEPDTAQFGGDCDDTNPSVNPGASEACDGIDNDCDAATTDGAAEPWVGLACDGSDADACLEGALSCDGGAQVCSDATGDAVETCNDIDDDCDGVVDEGLATFTYWADSDGDGWGDASSPLDTCETPAPAGYVANDGDCDDSDPAVRPEGTETACNDLRDNDCDGLVDAEDGDCAAAECDADGDGYDEAGCDPGASTLAPDCNDADPMIYPGGPELCDARDGDCDGTADNPACDAYDRNGDGRVDGRELAWVGRAFGSCSLDPPAEWWFPVDYDRDGCVGGDDLAILANVWAKLCSGDLLVCD